MSAQQLAETLAPFVDTFEGERREGAAAMLALAQVCARALDAQPPQDDPQPDDRETMVKRVLALHYDDGPSQGYFNGGYEVHDHCCATCGSHGEYGVAWPCATARTVMDDTAVQS